MLELSGTSTVYSLTAGSKAGISWNICALASVLVSPNFRTDRPAVS